MNELHPPAVHFPIVLAMIWPLLDASGLFWNKPALRIAGLTTLCFAAAFSLFATATGQAAFDAAIAADVPAKVLNTHADNANLMPWLMLLMLTVRVVAPRKFGRTGDFLALALGLGLFAFALYVGSSGGDLVFGHGVGVQATP